MTDPKQKKILLDEYGKSFVALVPDAWEEWSRGKEAEAIGRYMHWIAERANAGDEGALSDVPFLATREHIDAWDECRSVPDYEH